MSSDSQNNKQDFHGNVIPIRPGDDGTEIEQKLAAARRLFSLHEYGLCEQVIQEILAVDPHSSKAKALLELTSIKLSKRKLYKKMVDPKQPPRSLAPPSQIEPPNFGMNRNPSPRRGTTNRGADLQHPVKDGPLEGTLPPAMSSNRRPLQARPGGAGEKTLGFPTNSMRERTIEAMTELLKDRNKGVGDWKDPKFVPLTHQQPGNDSEVPASDSGNAVIPPTTPREPILEAPPTRRIVSRKRERTIEAMTERLRDRNKGIGDWKDLEFGPLAHSQPGNDTETPASDFGKPTIPATTPQEPILEAPPTRRIVSMKEEKPLVLKETVTQILPEEKSTLEQDFLPGSLEELFETPGDFHQKKLTEAEFKAQSIEITPSTPGKSTQEKGQSSPAEFFETKGEPLQGHETIIPLVGISSLPVIPISEESKAFNRGEEGLFSVPADLPLVPTKEIETKPAPDQSPTVSTPPPKTQELTPPKPTPSQERKQQVVHLPNVNVFERITPARETPPLKFIDRKLEQRSEEIRNSEIKAVSIAQIKKYLYQEQFDLCSQELERIRGLFPQNMEIQAFVENTSRRLVDLKALKNFEGQAKELMRSAVSNYQEGKFHEALATAQQVLQVNPNHTHAREFVEFVQRRINPEQKKELDALLERYCKNCGANVDPSSQFCHHCGRRLQ